jgi:hypothetical protein
VCQASGWFGASEFSKYENIFSKYGFQDMEQFSVTKGTQIHFCGSVHLSLNGWCDTQGQLSCSDLSNRDDEREGQDETACRQEGFLEEVTQGGGSEVGGLLGQEQEPVTGLILVITLIT